MGGGRLKAREESWWKGGNEGGKGREMGEGKKVMLDTYLPTYLACVCNVVTSYGGQKQSTI